MVIRDLTLRSAASFGSFHLIRLLYDEYMFYVVEDKVASVLNKTPIAVMAQVSNKCRKWKTWRIFQNLKFHQTRRIIKKSNFPSVYSGKFQ